jgi:hypothetical protein
MSTYELLRCWEATSAKQGGYKRNLNYVNISIVFISVLRGYKCLYWSIGMKKSLKMSGIKVTD